jgi:hypothetical protein
VEGGREAWEGGGVGGKEGWREYYNAVIGWKELSTTWVIIINLRSMIDY